MKNLKHHKFDDEEPEIIRGDSLTLHRMGASLSEIILKHFYGGEVVSDYRAKRWFHFLNFLTTLTWAFAYLINDYYHLSEHLATTIFVVTSLCLQLICFFSFSNPDLSITAITLQNQLMNQIRWLLLLIMGCGYGGLLVAGAAILVVYKESLEFFVSAFIAFQIAFTLTLVFWLCYAIFYECTIAKRQLRTIYSEGSAKTRSENSLETDAACSKGAEALTKFFVQNQTEVAKILQAA